MSSRRANPFRSQNRENFPPLDEFFDDNQSSGLDAVNISAISLDHSFQSRVGPCKELNFSVDMSIGGKAEMAQHRYQVQKYGIDGSLQSGLQDDDRSISPRKGLRLNSTGDDWDRLMDDNVSNVSFSSTVIATAKSKWRAVKMGFHTPTPDQSSDDDSGSSFFNKSAVQSLITPEKIVYKLGDGSGRDWGVTLSRGIQVHEDSSDSSDSPNRSTVSSPASDFDRMFLAKLRFNEEMDEDWGTDFNDQSFTQDFEQFSDDRSSGGNDDHKDKRSFVSFAADTSFATSNSKHRTSSLLNCHDQNSGKQSVNEISMGLDFLQASRIVQKNVAKSLPGSEFPPTTTTLKQTIDTNFGVDFIFQGDQSHAHFSNDADKSEVSSLASSACPTPQMSPFVNEATMLPSVGCQAKAFSSLFGLSPIVSHASQNVLRLPPLVPIEKTPLTASVPLNEPDDFVTDCCDSGGAGDKNLLLSVPFDESLPAESHSNFTAGKSTKRILFGEEHDTPSPLCIESVTCSSIGMAKKKPSDLCCTLSTVQSKESYVSMSMTPEACILSSGRTFGSNAAFRINAHVVASGKPAGCKKINRTIPVDLNSHSLTHEMVGEACGVAGTPPGKYYEPVTTSMEIQDTTWPMTPHELRSLTRLDFSAEVVMQSLRHTAAYPKPVEIPPRSSDYNSNSKLEFRTARNRRGVRLSRLSKLKELGLEHKLKPSTYEEYELGDSSF